jgi:hypothetical protein
LKGNELRLLLYWGRQENTSVLSMRREDWESVVGSGGMPVRFDVRSTPMARMSDVSSVLGSIIHEIGSTTARFSVYRYDVQDIPTPINQDDFTVWTDLSAHPKLAGMIEAASTPNDENLKNFCREHVFFVKQKPGQDHWQAMIPSSVTIVLNSTSVSK